MENHQKEYVNYHKHSDYSNIKSLDCVTKMKHYCERAIELGHTVLSTVEHGYQGNIFESNTLADKYNLKMIVGVEAYYVPSRFEKDRRNFHIIIIAKNTNGYKQINKIISESNLTGMYYKPRIDRELLFNLNANDVIITTACTGGIVRKDFLEAEQLIKDLKNKFGDNLYLEVQNHLHINQIEHNKKVIELSNKYGIKLIHANDSHYIYPEDSKYRDLFLQGKQIRYEEEEGYMLDYPSYDEVVNRYLKQGVLTEEQIYQSIDNTLIFKQCEDIDVNKDIKLPKISDNPKKEFQDIITREWNKEKVNVPKSRWKEYVTAIQYESSIVDKTNMYEYFLLNYKVIKNGVQKYGGVISRTGRGSCPSFYINKLLGLTNIDRLNSPITLYPTRFMSIERILGTRSLPDIDSNLADREPFIKATQDILGKDGVHWLLTYKPLQNSGAFRLWCKANELKYDEYNEVAKNLDTYLDHPYWGEIIKQSERFVGVIESVAPSPCFEKDVLVMTNEGYKKIQDIKKGDYVLTHNNKFKMVNTPMKKYSQDILEVKFMGSERIKVTSEHPFYIKRKDGVKYYKKENGKYSSVRKFTEPQWIAAKDLTKGDYIGFAINQNSILPQWNGVQNNNYKDVNLLNKIDVTDKNFWWLIGRYIGDGWTHMQISNKGWVEYYRTIICCNKNNNELFDITTVLDKMNYKYTVVEERTVYKIQISNKELYEYLQQFGKYSYGKKLTNDILDLPRDYLKVFLEGYFSADGHYIKGTGVQCLSTASKELAYGLQHCIHKAYRCPTRLTLKNGTQSIIEGREVNTRISYELRFKVTCDINTIGFYEDGYIWQPFRELNHLEYNDYVYNMSVCEDESYTVNNMIVHNCSFLLLDKPISEEVGILKVGEEYCANLDGYNCDVYKYLKNDYLSVSVWLIISETCKLIGMKIPTINELVNLLDEETFRMYELGLTATLNQADTDFGTECVRKLKPKTVGEMSAFVASIRPGFASLLDNFLNRKPYTTGVQELDELLEDSYHYLMYQESIMKFLVWLGMPESQTYDIIKKISKKKFNEQELIDLKDELKKGWVNHIGTEEGFEPSWQVVEDAAHYSFNASHSLSVALDSLYGAYLKSHYPLQYYTVALNINDDDIKKTSKLISELDYFNIKLEQPKFGFSKAKYFFEAKNRVIYKGVGSIKYLNEKVADELYELYHSRDGQFENFFDVLESLKEIGINSRQLQILIKIGYFNFYGKTDKLLRMYALSITYNKKTYKTDNEIAHIIMMFATGYTDKTITGVDNKSLLNFLAQTLTDKELPAGEIIKAQHEYTGSINYVNTKEEKSKCVVVSLDTKYTPKAVLYRICDGKTTNVKISSSFYNNNCIKLYDSIEVCKVTTKNKKKKVNNEWVSLDEVDYFIEYMIV